MQSALAMKRAAAASGPAARAPLRAAPRAATRGVAVAAQPKLKLLYFDLWVICA